MGCGSSASKTHASDEVPHKDPAPVPECACTDGDRTHPNNIDDGTLPAKEVAAVVSPLPEITLPSVEGSSWDFRVQTITGQLNIVRARPDDTIRIVKARLRQQRGGPLENKIFKLVFQGQSLDPSSTVSALLQRGSIVNVVTLEKEEADGWWDDERNFKSEMRSPLNDPFKISRNMALGCGKAVKDWALEFDIEPHSASHADHAAILHFTMEPAQDQRIPGIWFNPRATKIRVHVRGPFLDSSEALPIGAKTHVAIRLAGGTMTIFFDGRNVGTKTGFNDMPSEGMLHMIAGHGAPNTRYPVADATLANVFCTIIPETEETSDRIE